MILYEKMINTKVVRIVETYNFAFGLSWIHTKVVRIVETYNFACGLSWIRPVLRPLDPSGSG
jgi:hypothetical protein